MPCLKNIVVGLLFFFSITFAEVPDTPDHKKLAQFYTIQGDIQKQYNILVEKKLQTIGYNLTNPHKRVNDQYETKYGATVLDVLSFLPVVNDKVILPLLNIDPRIAGFAPFNMLIYKKLDENSTHIGHLMPEVMLDILGITNNEVRQKFSGTFNALDSMIESEIKGEKSFAYYDSLPQHPMINFEYSFEEQEDIEDFIDTFQNDFELAFINQGYLIAGYHNFMEATDDAEEILSGYDAFWTYSLCHLEFSYGVFDNENARPDAGLFAPCTMYVYIKKGTNKLVIGMYRLHNWSQTLSIDTQSRVALIEKLDTQIPQILKNFGMIEINNKSQQVETLPTKKIVTATVLPPKVPNVPATPIVTKIPSLPVVPQVPKPIYFGSGDMTDRSIKFSKRVPPNYIPHRFDTIKKTQSFTNRAVGEVYEGRVSAYLRGEFIDVDTAKQKLIDAGFEIVTTVPLNKKGTLFSIVFTDNTLIQMASQPNRGFIASLRLLVDTQNRSISITNPIYMSKGFLQQAYDKKLSKKILDKLLSLFNNLKNSKDILKFQSLAHYHFMKAMPYYEDMVEVASGDDLLERIQNNKKVLFSQTLANGATLIGIELGKRTRKFTKKIGRNNAGMLPYPVLIENGKAKILDPKYYISYMYPMLKMSQFMMIASIPDAIVKDVKRVFRKR